MNFIAATVELRAHSTDSINAYGLDYCGLAHKARAEAKEKTAPFGFNKKEETDDDDNSN